MSTPLIIPTGETALNVNHEPSRARERTNDYVDMLTETVTGAKW